MNVHDSTLLPTYVSPRLACHQLLSLYLLHLWAICNSEYLWGRPSLLSFKLDNSNFTSLEPYRRPSAWEQSALCITQMFYFSFSNHIFNTLKINQQMSTGCLLHARGHRNILCGTWGNIKHKTGIRSQKVCNRRCLLNVNLWGAEIPEDTDVK